MLPTLHLTEPNSSQSIQINQTSVMTDQTAMTLASSLVGHVTPHHPQLITEESLATSPSHSNTRPPYLCSKTAYNPSIN